MQQDVSDIFSPSNSDNQSNGVLAAKIDFESKKKPKKWKL